MKNKIENRDDRIIFTKEMRKDYTILAPMMAPIHFALIERVFVKHGYRFEILNTTDRKSVV